MNKRIHEYINETVKSGIKSIETQKLLEWLELKMGGEGFELAGGYTAFSSKIDELCTNGRLSPVKKAGLNGMSPAVFAKFRIKDIGSTDEDALKKEIISMHPLFKKDFYLKNIKQYEKDRPYVKSINNFFQKPDLKDSLSFRCTYNERSFEIWNDEKFLDKMGGPLLNRLGLKIGDLNCYRTFEAFFYIFLNRSKDGNTLIIENKDTFMSLVRAMNRNESEKHDRNGINLLIYGEGSKIIKSFGFISEISKDKSVGNIYYYGDIDYPGINIYQILSKKFSTFNILPHTGLYESLLDSVERPPEVKSSVRVDIGKFLSYFDVNTASRIRTLLEKGRYVPQEGLSFAKGEFEI